MGERNGPWSDLENDAIVADYMAMLADDLAGRQYSKAEHNRQLQELIRRGRGSIEYKHQNISAVLKGLGETWIEGYKPAFNYQASLEDAVARWLQQRPGWYASKGADDRLSMAAEPPGALWIMPAPTLSNAPPPDEAEQMARWPGASMSRNEISAIARSVGQAKSGRSIMSEASWSPLTVRTSLARSGG